MAHRSVTTPPATEAPGCKNELTALFGSELDDEAYLALAEDRFDRAHDSGLAGDLDPVARLERRFARQPPGSDDLVTPAQLVLIGDGQDARLPVSCWLSLSSWFGKVSLAQASSGSGRSESSVEVEL